MKYALRVSLLSLCLVLIGTNYAVASELQFDYSKKPLDMLLTYTKTPTATGSHILAQVMVATYNVPLNAFEVELRFDPTALQAKSIQFHDALCEDRFVIEQTIDQEAGIIRASCGTITPFITGSDALAVLSVSFAGESDVAPPVWFGARTGLHIHNGLGTKATVELSNLAISG